LQVLVLYWAPLQAIFETEALTLGELAITWLVAAIVFVCCRSVWVGAHGRCSYRIRWGRTRSIEEGRLCFFRQNDANPGVFDMACSPVEMFSLKLKRPGRRMWETCQVFWFFVRARYLRPRLRLRRKLVPDDRLAGRRCRASQAWRPHRPTRRW